MSTQFLTLIIVLKKIGIFIDFSQNVIKQK